MSVDDAYRISAYNLSGQVAEGGRICGFKAGLTAAPIRSALGAVEPDIGALLDSMFLPIDAPIDASRFLQPRLEIELAFVLADVPASPSPEHVLAATSHVVAAFEIIDSRIGDWRVRLTDTIADNASSGAVVLGDEPVDPRGIDLTACQGCLVLNGAVVASGTADAVLGDPLASAAWIARSVSRLDSPIEPGHVLLTGSFTAPVAVKPGDTATAEITGFRPVTVRFS